MGVNFFFNSRKPPNCMKSKKSKEIQDD